MKLDTSNVCQDTDILTKIIKKNADIFAFILLASFKKANITPVFKKGDRNSKDNYRPVSLLPNLSKIFERCMFRQLYNFMLEFLSKYQSGFRKDYSTQNCMLAMLEN